MAYQLYNKQWIELEKLYDQVDQEINQKYGNRLVSHDHAVCALVKHVKYQQIHSKAGKRLNLIEIYIYDDVITKKSCLYQYWGNYSADYLRFHLRRGDLVILSEFEAKIPQEISSNRFNMTLVNGFIEVIASVDSETLKLLPSHILSQANQLLASSCHLREQSLRNIYCNNLNEVLYCKRLCQFSLVFQFSNDGEDWLKDDIYEFKVTDCTGNVCMLSIQSSEISSNLRNVLSTTPSPKSILCSHLCVDRAYSDEIKTMVATKDTLFTPQAIAIFEDHEVHGDRELIPELLWSELMSILTDTGQLQAHQGKQFYVKAKVDNIQLLHEDGDSLRTGIVLPDILHIDRSNGIEISYKPAIATLTSPEPKSSKLSITQLVKPSLSLLDSIGYTQTNGQCSDIRVVIQSDAWKRILYHIPASVIAVGYSTQSSSSLNQSAELFCQECINLCNGLLNKLQFGHMEGYFTFLLELQPLYCDELGYIELKSDSILSMIDAKYS